MTKAKKNEIEKFYLLNREKLIDEIDAVLKNRLLSEEVLHQVMFKCIVDISKWRGREELTFDYVIDLCFGVICEIEAEKEITSPGFSIAIDPCDVIEWEERYEVVVSLVQNMRTYSSVLKMYLLENYPMCEIARMLNMRPNTVSKHVHRGLVKLKTQLKKSKYFQL